MTSLDVPFRQQISEASCGTAAFEMVYRYFRPSKLSKFSQEKVYARLQEATPDGEFFRVSTDNLVSLGHARHFFSEWGRISPTPEELVEQIRFFVERERVPLIACQQWHLNKKNGHFRVIIGISENEVRFHDPEPGHGGPNLVLSIPAFIEQWRPLAAMSPAGLRCGLLTGT